MAQHHELMAEHTPSMEMTGRSYVVARLLSQILHPMVTVTLNFLIVGFFALSHHWKGVAWAVFIIAIQVVPPMTLYLVRLRQGVYGDVEISNRHQRNELYMFTFLTLFCAVLFIYFIGAPLPFIALLSSGLVLNLVSWFVNLFWKISVHSATAAMCATTALIYSFPLGILMWMGTIAVGWSRIRTRNHTPLQVLAGIIVATGVVVVLFSGFGIIS